VMPPRRGHAGSSNPPRCPALQYDPVRELSLGVRNSAVPATQHNCFLRQELCTEWHSPVAALVRRAGCALRPVSRVPPV
jgi:hypothetical protein